MDTRRDHERDAELHEARRARWRELAEAAAEPASDDPATWTPPEVLALAARYAVAVELLPHHDEEAWALADDESAQELLFVRDLLESWLRRFGEEALLELAEATPGWEEVPLPSESDERLLELYAHDERVRTFLDAEYARFRELVEPPRDHRWWWLDAELAHRQIH